MNSEHPYLNSQLSLPQLADQLGVSVHYLSQIINQQLGQNFFDFINHYRIIQSKVLLQDTNHKKHTGMTPGEYRKHNIVSLQNSE